MVNDTYRSLLNRVSSNTLPQWMMNMHSGLSWRKKWVTSERIALGVLEEYGFHVVETGRKIVLNNIEVGEVDAFAVDSEGNSYAVEIKAGKIDVSGIRQAYVNALLTNSKPLVVCKGYADEAARELAEKLGVKVILLSDVFLVESEELHVVVREAVEEALVDYFEIIHGLNIQLRQEHLDVLNAINSSSTIEEAAGSLGVDISTLIKKIDELRKQGIIPKWASRYSDVKKTTRLILQKHELAKTLEESTRLQKTLRSLEEEFKALQSTLQSLSQQVSKLSSSISKLDKNIE